MRVDVYALCYNEEVILPYFLRHYASVADRIVVFDNGSTDRSREMVLSCPKAEIRDYDTGGRYLHRAQMAIKNGCYRESRGKADWVIVVDTDEFIYHPNLLGVLARYTEEKITLPLTDGYEMVAPGTPTTPGQVYEEFPAGYASVLYSKPEVFHPDIDINFELGCHEARPAGPVKRSERAEIKLLHYRHLGVPHYVQKYRTRMARLGDEDLRLGWGAYVPPTGQSLEEYLAAHYARDLAGKAVVRVV